MSQLEKLKGLASGVGIDFDELLNELKSVLVGGIAETVRDTLGKMERNTEKYVDGKLTEFRESLNQVIEAQVEEGLKPIVEMAEKAKAAREKQPATAAADNPASNDEGGAGREMLLAKGLGLLETIIQNNNPLAQLQRMGELRRAFYDFEPPGVSPDVQARIAGQSFIEGLKLAGKGKPAPLVDKPGGGSGAPSRDRSRPSPADPGPGKPLLDVVREWG